jgi:hypothetical protein
MEVVREKYDVQHEVQHEVQRGIWVPTQQLIKTSHHQSNTTIYSHKTLRFDYIIHHQTTSIYRLKRRQLSGCTSYVNQRHNKC